MNYYTIESERLQFRKLTRNDIPTWIEFFIDNDRLHFLGIDLDQSKEELAEAWIESQLVRYKNGSFGHLAAERKSTGEFVGMGGILPRELDGLKEKEIAYSLLPKFWGNGFATEIAKTLRDFGFRNLEADRFISIIDVDNTDSAKVAKKADMTKLSSTQFRGMNVNIFGLTRERYNNELSSKTIED